MQGNLKCEKVKGHAVEGSEGSVALQNVAVDNSINDQVDRCVLIN